MPAKPAKRFAANPIRGRRPVLQNCTIAELAVDPRYQRSIDNPASQKLIRAIARDWDWSLCQPLVVAQRDNAGLFVVDGQHRLAAARLRGDIYDLPCVITVPGGLQEEAAAFRSLNQQRKPLKAVDLFKAALAGGEPDAEALMRLIAAAGLQLAPHDNWKWWQPGQIGNIGGIQRCLAAAGEELTGQALTILARAFDGQVLRFGGTIYGALWRALVEIRATRQVDADLMTMVLAGQEQPDWVRDFLAASAAESVQQRQAAVQVLVAAYAEAEAELQDVEEAA